MPSTTRENTTQQPIRSIVPILPKGCCIQSIRLNQRLESITNRVNRRPSSHRLQCFAEGARSSISNLLLITGLNFDRWQIQRQSRFCHLCYVQIVLFLNPPEFPDSRHHLVHPVRDGSVPGGRLSAWSV